MNEIVPVTPRAERKPARSVTRVTDLGTVRAARAAGAALGTVQAAWDAFLASDRWRQMRVTSHRVYRQVMREAVAALPPQPTYREVVLWLDGLERKHCTATRNKYSGVLKGVVTAASYVTGDMPLSLVVKQLQRAKVPARERRDASPETVARLYELAQDAAEELSLRLASRHGLRVGEILGLQPTDVRTDGGMRIRVVRTRDRDGVRPRKNAANGKPHIVRITDGYTQGLVLALGDVRVRNACARRNGGALAADYLIPWGHCYAQAVMDRWRRDPGVTLPKGDAWHSLRHYGATCIAASGASVVTLMAWLGDSTPTAAMTYIAQVRGTTEGGDELVTRAFEAHALLKSRPGYTKPAAEEVPHDTPQGVGVTTVDAAVTPTRFDICSRSGSTSSSPFFKETTNEKESDFVPC